MDRLTSLFTAPSPSRVYMLYGAGVQDIYLNSQLQELPFEAALFETLHLQGFERIVYFTMHRSVYFYDDHSRALSRPPVPDRLLLQQGPLPGLRVYQPPLMADAPTAVESGSLMGDLLALRMLDTLLHQTDGPRTALIFPQAETTFRFFEDPRTLAGLIGDWVQLSPSNPNAAVFVFATDDYSALSHLADSLPVPEFRTLIQRVQVLTRPAPNLCHLGGPDSGEISNLLTLFQQRGAILVQAEAHSLAVSLAQSGLLMRYWLACLAAAPRLDMFTARQAGWIESHGENGLEPWQELDALVGLAPIKQRLREQAAWVELQKTRGRISSATLHMIFTGNPGTGKTTVARLIGEIFLRMGVLRRGHLVEVRGSELTAEHVGGTAVTTNTIIDRAMDGVLFIDEAYTLVERERGGFGKEALDTLLTRLEEARDRLVVIAAGYPEPMRRFRMANPGLKRRFPEENVLDFPDFSPEELWQILQNMLTSRNIPWKEPMGATLLTLIQGMYRIRDEGFGNAGEMRNLAEALDRRRASRIFSLLTTPAAVRPSSAASQLPPGSNHLTQLPTRAAEIPLELEDLPETYRAYLPSSIPNLPDLLSELDNLIGIEPIKTEIRSLVERLQIEQIRLGAGILGNVPSPLLQNTLLVGNPGTGKTTVARLLGRCYHSLGLLTKGHIVEVSRAELVAGYVGQTALKTMDKIKEALDGVLFIDEAYSLDGGGGDFGREAVDTLVKAVEDYKHRLIVILAGYPDPMDEFLSLNPGLSSRFPLRLVFPDFSDEELGEILHLTANQAGYTLAEGVLQTAQAALRTLHELHSETFGNARAVLHLFERMRALHAQRVLPLLRDTPEKELPALLNTMLPADVPAPKLTQAAFFA